MNLETVIILKVWRSKLNMPWADEDGACAASPCCIAQLKSNCGGKLSVDKSVGETNQECSLGQFLGEGYQFKKEKKKCSLALKKFPHTQEKLEAD